MLLKTKIEIESWLKKNEIKNYKLVEDKEYGYVVNVSGNVDLSDNKLLSIDVKFNIIKGSFDCRGNLLTSLLGCPKIVNGDFFDCSYNQLTSLEFSPEIVNGMFCSNKNKLKKTNLFFNEIKTNKVFLIGNKELDDIQKITNLNEIKKILKIYQEKADLIKLVEVTDKSIESTDLIRTVVVENLNNNSNKSLESIDIIKNVKKINKL